MTNTMSWFKNFFYLLDVLVCGNGTSNSIYSQLYCVSTTNHQDYIYEYIRYIFTIISEKKKLLHAL